MASERDDLKFEMHVKKEKVQEARQQVADANQQAEAALVAEQKAAEKKTRSKWLERLQSFANLEGNPLIDNELDALVVESSGCKTAAVECSLVWTVLTSLTNRCERIAGSNLKAQAIKDGIAALFFGTDAKRFLLFLEGHEQTDEKEAGDIILDKAFKERITAGDIVSRWQAANKPADCYCCIFVEACEAKQFAKNLKQAIDSSRSKSSSARNILLITSTSSQPSVDGQFITPWLLSLLGDSVNPKQKAYSHAFFAKENDNRSQFRLPGGFELVPKSLRASEPLLKR